MQGTRPRKKPQRLFGRILGTLSYKPRHLIRITNKKALVVTFVAALVIQLMVPIFATHGNSAYAAGATYYVSPNGNDGNSGIESAPFRTISKAVSIASAGDTVLVRDGTYYETVTMQRSGTSSAPIVIKNYPGERPKLDGASTRSILVNSNGQGYIHFEGFELTNYLMADHAGGFKIIGGSGKWEIVNCNIHDPYGYVDNNWYGGIYSESYNGSLLIEGVTVSNTGNFNMWLDSTTGPITINNSIFLRAKCRSICIIDGASKGVTIDNNLIGDMLPYGGSIHGETIFAHGGSFTISNNLFRNPIGSSGGYTSVIALFENTGHSKVYNNVVWGNSNNSTYGTTGFFVFETRGNLTDIQIFNNTLAGNIAGIAAMDATDGNARVYNNFYPASANLTGGNGLPNGGSAGNNLQWSNLNDYFVNPTNNDYHLKAGSPAIDKGSNSPSGVALPSTDKDGNARFVNSVVDIGAYEYSIINSSAPTSDTATPTTDQTQANPVQSNLTQSDATQAKLTESDTAVGSYKKIDPPITGIGYWIFLMNIYRLMLKMPLSF